MQPFVFQQPQDALPDVFVWLIANGKRIAYHRFVARDLIYSLIEEESGVHCGKVQTIFLRLPGNKINTPTGWAVQAKLSIYLWIGVLQNKQFSYSGLPKGFDLSQEIRNAERPGAMAPSNIHYIEKYVRPTHLVLFLWTNMFLPYFLFSCRRFSCVLIFIKRDP